LRRHFHIWTARTALSDDRASDDLDRRIAAAKAMAEPGEARLAKPAKGYSQGARVIAELIGAPIGGFVIGFTLDRWLGTSPWCLLVLLALSFVVAFRNVYKISKEQAE
jgi:ATP synthase protein I